PTLFRSGQTGHAAGGGGDLWAGGEAPTSITASCDRESSRGCQRIGLVADRGQIGPTRRGCFRAFQLVSGCRRPYIYALTDTSRPPASADPTRALRGHVPIDTVQTQVALFQKCRQFTAAREAQAAGLYPYFKPIAESEDTVVVIEGRKLVMLGSNNYL